LAVAATASALASSPSAAAPNAADAAAIERGRQALTWIAGYQCPAPGQPISVPGVASSAEAQQVRQENWAFAQGRLAAIAEAARARQQIESEVEQAGGRPGRSMQKALAALDDAIAATSARAATALTQWSLATWVGMSRLDGDFDILGGGSHPLAPYEQDGEALETLAQSFGGALNPIVAKYRQCLSEMNSAIIEQNLPQIRAAADRRVSSAQMTELIDRLDRYPVDPSSAGGAFLAELKGKRDSLAAAETARADAARAQADKATRDRLAADARRGQAIAAQYVNAIAAGRIDAAIGLLSDDVFLSSPQGNARGRQAVATRMRQAATEGAGASPMQAPQIDASFRVYSAVRGQRGSGKIYFTFQAGRISGISLVQD
jgi:hypothetical protein